LPSFRILPWLTVLTLAACSTLSPHDAPPAGQPASASAVTSASASAASQRLDDALRLIANQQFDAGLAALQSVIDAHSFASLPSDDQYRALVAAGRAEMRFQRWSLARGYMTRAAAMPQAIADERLALVTIGWHLHDQPLIAESLTAVARKWPDRLGKIDEDYLTAVLAGQAKLPRATALALLESLYAANFKLKWDIEPSESWRDLMLLLIEQGRQSEAVDVSARITDPLVLIEIRSDRRFDTVVAAHPEAFDAVAAADRQIQWLQAKDEDGANSLRVKTLLMAALMRRHHAAAALAIADDAIAEIRDTNYPERRYVDYLAEYGDLLTERAYVLVDLGLWDEGVAQLKAAAREFEHDRDNVNAAIDLAGLECDLAHPAEARSVLAQITEGLSPYGEMQVESVRLDVATQEGDAAQVGRSLSYARAHRGEAPISYLSDLIIANQLDRAAEELRRQLLDPDTRQNALGNVQTYTPEPATPRDLEMRARWLSVRARPDVQQAIAKVGRVASYDMEGSLF
jgi:beta-barrel assembly-enhancing protease